MTEKIENLAGLIDFAKTNDVLVLVDNDCLYAQVDDETIYRFDGDGPELVLMEAFKLLGLKAERA